MPAATRRRPKTSAPELGESPEHEAGEGPDEEVREGAEDMPPMSKGRRGRRGRKAVKDGSCSACAAGKPCSGKKDGDTSAGPGELYNPGRKNPRMNNDALSPQEYLDACDLGIQNESKAYIRARLDTEDAIREDFRSRSSSGQSQNNGSTVRKVATGAAIAGGVAALAIGGHRSGAFRRAGSALRKAAPRVRTAASSGMGRARSAASSGFGRARSAANSGMGRARSGFATASTRARSAGSTGMKRARTGFTNTSARAKSSFGTARRSASNTMARARGKSPKQLSLFNDSMYADGFTIDADVFDGLVREDVKCGAGAISKGEKCTKGAGGGSPSIGRGAAKGAKWGAIINGGAGAAVGMAMGGVPAAAVLGGTNAASGALIGAGIGGGINAVRKLGHAAGNNIQRNRANNAKIQSSMAKLDPRHRAEMQRARSKGASRSEMQALRQKHAREVTQSLQRIGA
jgi:hypothetical protein